MNDIKTIYDAIHKKYKDLVNSLTRKEDKSNKVSTVTESNEQYPTAKAVNDKVTELANEVGVDLDKYKEYFTIEATEDGTTVYFRQSDYAVNDGLDPLKVEVSTDDGATWTEVTAAPAEDDVPGATLASLNAGEKVLIRGRNQAYGYLSDSEGEAVDNCNFWADHECKVSGNIMSLVGGDDFARLRTVADYGFSYFFSDYNSELEPWVVLDEEDPLLLPATTLAEFCYCGMFQSVPELTSTPELPATTLALGCYTWMFSGCTGLTAAPALPTITLAERCYYSMFQGCTSLTSAPALPATILAESCYNQMFDHCAGLTTAPELPATTLANRCYSNMFRDCTGLTAAPTLPATALAEACYGSMFEGCTGLTAAPELPATTLTNECYNYMFFNCTNLAYIKALFTTTPGNTYTSGWVNNVAANGTFVKSASATWSVTGDDGVPSGWTVKEGESTGNVPVTTAPMSLTEAQKEQIRENIGISDPIIIDLEEFHNQRDLSLETALSCFKIDGKSVSYDEMRNLVDEKRNILLRYNYDQILYYCLNESCRYLFATGVEFVFGSRDSISEIGFMARIKLAGDESRVEFFEF